MSSRPADAVMAYTISVVRSILALVVVFILVERASGQAIAADAQCLLDFKSSVTDPQNNLATWKESDVASICFWAGVQCFGNLALPVYKLLLSRFDLSSTWPTALTKCTSLQTLDLSYNDFTGPIPDNICEAFPNFVTLNLQHNSFNGVIPASLGTCKYLNELILNDNRFEGELPSQLAQLTRLSHLNVSDNNLSGVIPSAFAATIPGTNVARFNASSFAGNSYLCGAPLTNSCTKLPSKESKTGAIVGGIVGGVVAFLFLLGLGFWCYLRRSRSQAKKVLFAKRFAKRRLQNKVTFTKDRKWLQRIRDPNAITVSMFDNPVNRIGFTELMEGTSNFSRENIISTNATGTVYKAMLPDNTAVAIKRLRVSSHNDKAFMTEMEALGNLKHRNLVPLLGYCVAAGERLLVYQFMPNGTLWDSLHPITGKSSLPWPDRVKIATGAARGLAFLHHSCNPRVLHRNVNTKSILLDIENEPRITDFGLARLTNPNDTHVSTFFNGDYGDVGFVAPETIRTFVATMKGDVYSFGVVLLELVTGQKAADVTPVSDEDFRGNLVEYVTGLSIAGKAVDAVDPSVKGSSDVVDEEILRILKVAVSCVSTEAKERPSMFEVYQLLRAIGQKYNYTSPYDDLPTLNEDEVHVDVHEAIRVEVHVAE